MHIFLTSVEVLLFFLLKLLGSNYQVMPNNIHVMSEVKSSCGIYTFHLNML
jgi:hypothetical protein